MEVTPSIFVTVIHEVPYRTINHLVFIILRELFYHSLRGLLFTILFLFIITGERDRTKCTAKPSYWEYFPSTQLNNLSYGIHWVFVTNFNNTTDIVFHFPHVLTAQSCLRTIVYDYIEAQFHGDVVYKPLLNSHL